MLRQKQLQQEWLQWLEKISYIKKFLHNAKESAARSGMELTREGGGMWVTCYWQLKVTLQEKGKEMSIYRHVENSLVHKNLC